jgi:hypothetical protein
MVVLVLALTTCIATGLLNVPDVLVGSTYTTVIMVMLSLGGFSRNPMLGVAFFLLTAVLLFYRNVRNTTVKLQRFVPNTEEDDYFTDTPKNAKAPAQNVLNAVIDDTTPNTVLAPSANISNTPSAQLDHFLQEHRAASDGSAVNSSLGEYGETTIPNQKNGVVRDYSTFGTVPRSYNEFNETGPTVEGFTSEPASFSDLGAPTEGQYPIEADRSSSLPDRRDYTYRPESDTGSNTFTRFGPNLDEKKDAFQYK